MLATAECDPPAIVRSAPTVGLGRPRLVLGTTVRQDLTSFAVLGLSAVEERVAERDEREVGADLPQRLGVTEEQVATVTQAGVQPGHQPLRGVTVEVDRDVA